LAVNPEFGYRLWPEDELRVSDPETKLRNKSLQRNPFTFGMHWHHPVRVNPDHDDKHQQDAIPQRQLSCTPAVVMQNKGTGRN
jgi:hypothetical protein